MSNSGQVISNLKKAIRLRSFWGSDITGNQIHKAGKCRLTKATSNQELTFAVTHADKNGDEDIVKLRNFLTTSLKASCSCSGHYGGYCEHIVACIFYVIDYLENDPMKLMQIRKPAKTPKITLDKFNEKDLVKLCDKRVNEAASELLNKRKFSAELGLQNKIQVYFDIQHRESHFCSFHTVGNEIRHSCRKCLHFEGICYHRLASLVFLVQNYGKEVFDPKMRDLIARNELLEPYGFTLDTVPPNKFKFRREFLKLELVQLDPSIVPVKELRKAGFNKLSEEPISRLAVENLIRQSEIQSDKWGLEFIISPNGGLNSMPIKGVIGKLNKAGNRIKSHLDLYSPDDSPKLTLSDNQKEILQVIEFSQQFQLEPIEKLKIDLSNVPGIAGQTTELTDLYVMIDCLTKIVPRLENEKVSLHDGSEKFTTRTLKPVQISSEPIEMRFILDEDDYFYTLECAFFFNHVKMRSMQLRSLTDFLAKYDDLIFFHREVIHSVTFNYFIQNSRIKVSKQTFNSFYSDVLRPIVMHYPLEKRLNYRTIEAESSPNFRVYVEELDHFLMIRPVAEYGDSELDLFVQGPSLALDENGEMIEYKRHEDELPIKEFFVELHPEFANQVKRGFFYLPAEKVLSDNWFLNTFAAIRSKGIEILGLKNLKKLNYSSYKPTVSYSINSGTDWFDINMSFNWGDQKVGLDAVRKAIRKKQNYIRLDDGSLGILPEEWISKYAALMSLGQIEDDELKLSKLHFNVVDQLFDDIGNQDVLDELLEKRQKLNEFEKIDKQELPPQCIADVRDYQEAGFNWLCFLDEFGWGGCLADDMGLGKTLQVLTFLQDQINKHPEKNHLVIAPTTLLYNWENEIKKFYPDMKYLIHWGTDRTRDVKELQKHHLVLSSYGIMVNDVELFMRNDFHYIVLDESQAIKNPGSKRYKAARLLRGYNRLVMTGTPIENNTFDLYAQMSFLNPGLLGSGDSFKREFSNAIDKGEEPEKADLLRKLVHPFMLRRTKEQVAKELPEKTEAVLYCEMGSKQRKVYDAFKEEYRKKLLGQIDEAGINKSQIYILEGLLKLRQICDSPATLSNPENYGDDSVKIDELLNQIKEKTGNHKLLIFSQFVSMLSLIREQLDIENITYAYLDGGTRKRKQVVERFQNDEKCRVFLISLKAGGVGLNLTEADYVYIVDPWWNPQAETQAIDRTHRIGQTKKVFAYKMICKNTIEEKVLKLQEKKKKIAAEIVANEQNFVKSLSRDDIVELFS